MTAEPIDPFDEGHTPGPASISHSDFQVKVARYAYLRREQRNKQAEVDAVKDEANKLEAELLEDFTQHGTSKITVDGNTVHIIRKVKPRILEGYTREDVVQGLLDAGLTDLVKTDYNAITIAAWLKEQETLGIPMPPQLEGKLDRWELYSLGVVKA